MTDAPEKPHHLGHRERLRRRVLDRGQTTSPVTNYWNTC